MKLTFAILAMIMFAPWAGLLALNTEDPATWMPSSDDGTQLWWVEGSPQVFNSSLVPKEETLCFRYGRQKLLFDTKRVRPVDETWECAVVTNGQRYTCTGRNIIDDEFFQTVRFVESGRCFQRVIIDNLTCADSAGQDFSGQARLEITAWTDRLAFRLESDSEVGLVLSHREKQVRSTKSVLLEFASELSTATVDTELPSTLDEALGCHPISLPEESWSNTNGTYYAEEHLDRVDRCQVTLSNDKETPTVARLMFTQQNHLPITGFTPMLCELDGTPTGIPVQISKNWHQRPEKGHLPHEGPWFHGFTWVRFPPQVVRSCCRLGAWRRLLVDTRWQAVCGWVIVSVVLATHAPPP